tara:strand:+ start:58 stop:813 length:756 start_codon:yes stop_codon:yes gene_type:complete
MRISLLITITIILTILFHPINSNSNGTGSPGGKTNSPNDASNCTSCHSGILNTGTGTAYITSNIPVNGYVIGNSYTITLTGVKANCIKFGFELTAENGIYKSGDFMITDNTTKLVNANNAVTHKSSGTSGSTTKSWNVDWMPTSNSNGNTTFYAALMFANANSNNNGDNISVTSLSVNEEVANGITENAFKNSFHYNSMNKTIESVNSILVYNINGKLVLSTKKKLSTISHLKKGIYILKSKNKTQKIILN